MQEPPQQQRRRRRQEPPPLPPLFLAAVRDSAVFRRAHSARPALSLAALVELCDPVRNGLFDPRDRRVYMDMTRPLSDYFMSSSHNTYIGGNQLYGKASVRAIARALRQGVRVVELDCMDGTGRYADDGGIVVKHRYTPMVPVPLRACLEAIRAHAFAASAYPVILTLENHCGSHERQRQQAAILREVLGPLLYVPPASEDGPGGRITEMFASPEALRGKIVLRHKYKVYDLHNSNASSANSSRASSRAPSPSPASSVSSTPNSSPSPSPSASPARPSRMVSGSAAVGAGAVFAGAAFPVAPLLPPPPPPSSSSSSSLFSSSSSATRGRMVSSLTPPGKRRPSKSPPFSNIPKRGRPIPASASPPPPPIISQRPPMLFVSPSPPGRASASTTPSPTPTNANGTAPLILPESKDTRLDREKAMEIFQSKLGNNRGAGGGGGGGGGDSGDKIVEAAGAAVPPTIISKLPFGKKGRKSKKAIADALSDLVVVCNQKVKVKTLTLALQSPFALSCSWTEGKLKRALKSRRKLLKTMAFCRRHLMRVYPGMFRLDSSNFGPQKVWNAGVQMVALNTQTWGKPMALHAAKFEDNGGCGYVLKPAWLLGSSQLTELELEARGGGITDPELQPQMIMSLRPVACWVPYQGAAAAAAGSGGGGGGGGSGGCGGGVVGATGAGSGNGNGTRGKTGVPSDAAKVADGGGHMRANWANELTERNIRESNGVHSTMILTEYRDPMMSDSSITSSISTASSMSTLNFPAAEQRGGTVGSGGGGGNNNNKTTSNGSGGGGLHRSSSGQGEEGILLEAVMHGADPAGLEYRKQRRSSAVSKFYGTAPVSGKGNFSVERARARNSPDSASGLGRGTLTPGLGGSYGAEYTTAAVPAMAVPATAMATAPGASAGGSSGDETSSAEAAEYAAWKWDDEGPIMEFNIYEKKGPGMELLFCTVVYTDGGRKRRSVAQFSVAVSNMREGLRMVRLRNHQTGAFLQGGAACMLVDVTFRPMQDGDIVPDGPEGESAAACLGVGRG